MAVGECTVTTVSEEGSELLDRSTTKATHLKVQYSSTMVCNFGLLSILPFDEDEDSGSDEEGDSDESEGEFGASKTRSGKGYQNDDDDDDDPYIPQPLSKAPPWQRSDKHPSKVIDVEEADDAPKEGIQLERWGELPEIQESEGDDQSIDSLEISERKECDRPHHGEGQDNDEQPSRCQRQGRNAAPDGSVQGSDRRRNLQAPRSRQLQCPCRSHRVDSPTQLPAHRLEWVQQRR